MKIKNGSEGKNKKIPMHLFSFHIKLEVKCQKI